jgi:rare lipoprotein A
MNQHRLTCLSTVVITAFLAPIATVCTETLPALAVGSAGTLSQRSPRSLPIITPLTVTELETDVAVQAPSTASVKIAGRDRQVAKAPTDRPPSNSSQFVPTLPAFDDTIRVNTPVFSESSTKDLFTSVSTLPVATPTVDSALPNSTVVGNLPEPTLTELSEPEGTKIREVSPSILVIRSDNSPLKTIINSSTIEAEIANLPSVESSTKEIDTPSIADEIPTFSFNGDRPQQIVATAIVQIGDALITSQKSIGIPVERPDLATKPDRLISYKSNSQPAQMILDRVVATHTGKASWYGSESGNKTANGERFNPNGLTAAHRTLPFGTKVRVTSMRTGKSVTIRINDRGPFHGNRILDVSAGAAEVIGLKKDGVGKIRMEILSSKK